MRQDRDFLEAIAADPGDDARRLVYADWLEERGDPRAELVRLDASVAGLAPADGPRSDLLARLRLLRRDVEQGWLAQLDRPSPGWRIFRTKPVGKTYGKAIPAFIYNGEYGGYGELYSLVTVDAYADGAVDCRGFVDLDLFRREVAEGRVATRPPPGAMVGLLNLGEAQVAEARWEVSPEAVVRQVLEAVEELNPRGDGLIDMQGEDTKVSNNGARHKKLGLAQKSPYRVLPAGEEVGGAELPVFAPEGDGYRLTRWFFYADGRSQLGYASRLIAFEDVARMLEDGRLMTAVPPDAWLTIEGLGRFRAAEGSWYVDPRERVREAYDELDILRGGRGSFLRCVEAFCAYQQSPSEERREALRAAHEAVPAHLRDGDLGQATQRILYGDAEPEGPPD